MMDHDLRNLLRELAKHERGRGKRFPDDLRRRAGDWIRRRRTEGWTLGEVAAALGVCYERYPLHEPRPSAAAVLMAA
jgi:hypothetical protein